MKNTRQTILLFVIAVLICYLITTFYALLKQPNNIIVLEYGKLSSTEETEALIIRDEKVTRGENYKNGMLQIKTEGERVAKGEAIFRYYSNIEESMKQKMEVIEEQIRANMLEIADIPSSDIALIETQIKVKLDEVYNENDLQKIRESKTDINTYMSKKITIIGELAKENSKIKKLIEQKMNYENELAKNSEYINAEESGVVSYRVDNLEERLKTDDFSYINKEFLDSINVKAGQIIATSEEKGKVINNFQSYLAMTLNSENAKRAKIGDKVMIRLSNSEEIGAEVSYIHVEENDSRTIVLQITKKIEELIKYRKISLTVIWWEYNGFKVPNSAIISEENKNYVIRNRTGYEDKILVEIMRQNEDYSIIDNYSTDELKELGYTSKEINDMPKLNLYDEIMVSNN